MFEKHAPLSLKAFSLSFAVLLSILFGFTGLVAKANNAQEFESVFSSLLVGFDLSGAGIIVGVVWGFLIGGVLGLIFAWLYNKML